MTSPRTFKLLLPLLAALAASCGRPSAPSTSHAANVFGVDDRIAWSAAPGFPLQSVGKLSMGCTASLVSSRLLLTAAHCLAGFADGTGVSFQPFGANEPQQLATILSRGSSASNPWNAEGSDWAFLLLATPSPYPRIQVWAYGRADDDLVVGQPAWLMGYSTDLAEASLARNCAVRDRHDGALYHDCDLQGGASGGPLFIRNATGGLMIVGVQSSHAFCNRTACPSGMIYTLPMANRAIDALSFLAPLQQYFALYP